ncbi:unnamed protein product [Trichogramma brassicae]|uniref:Uncharacterized protein n=1 Tax=Trichogramma brassicae TaxID=86971 RepID=A0A6H5IS72_9HYME|nr:unnamed protein product [Trichogramma brassicae]
MSTSTVKPDTSMDIQKKVKKLTSLRSKFDSANQKARDVILGELYPVISDWEGQYPNLREIFQKKEIDWLLTKEMDSVVKRSGTSFMDFVIKTGYKDEPDVDEHGKPLLLRSTALHRVAKSEENDECVLDLFKIYCRFDANYIDKESNITHFHVACKYGCVDIVKKFIEFGQDLNFSGQKFLELPLHLALMFDCEEVVELLLKNGADPNVANMQGLTALHTICKRAYDDDVLEKFFKMCDKKNLKVQLDVWDEQCTCARARFYPVSLSFFWLFSARGEALDWLFSSVLSSTTAASPAESRSNARLLHTHTHTYIRECSSRCTCACIGEYTRCTYVSLLLAFIHLRSRSLARLCLFLPSRRLNPSFRSGTLYMYTYTYARKKRERE